MEGFFIYTKIRYKCDDDFWNRVKSYKRERHLEKLNDAVTELLSSALDKWEEDQKKVVYSKLGMKTKFD